MKKVASEEIGQEIRKRRKLSGLSQSGLAELIGSSGKAVYCWESGRRKPSLYYILRMSYVFGCEVGELIGGFQHEEKSN